MVKELNKLEKVTSSTKLLLTFVEHVENATRAALEREKSHPNDQLRPCNFNFKGWTNSVLTAFFLRGWTQPDLSCVTELHGDHLFHNQKRRYTADQLFDALQVRGDAIKANVKSITNAVIPNWTEPDFNYNAEHETRSQSCTVHPAGAMRIGRTWYYINALTNRPRHEIRGIYDRQWVDEFATIGRNGKFSRPALQILPRRPENGEEPIIITNTTTGLSSFRGPVVPAHFSNTYPDENLAVKDALDANSHFVQQAEDATTPSSIAILFLPFLINLVPISLFSQVSTITMLLYILMSDVLTVLPAAIKGTELIYISNKRVRAAVLRISSARNETYSRTAVVEFWVAECRSRGHVRTIGTIFITLSIFFFLLGVGSELMANNYARRRQALRLAALIENGPRFKYDRARAISKSSKLYGRNQAKGKYEAMHSVDFEDDYDKIRKT